MSAFTLPPNFRCELCSAINRLAEEPNLSEEQQKTLKEIARQVHKDSAIPATYLRVIIANIQTDTENSKGKNALILPQP